MSLVRSERERIRINLERIDDRLQDLGDCQSAAHAAALEQYREHLSLARQAVISQELLRERLSDADVGLSELGFKIEDLSRGIDALGCIFESGFDEIISQFELVREDLKQILKTLRRPLETQAKELARRGFEAKHNGWYEEALTDLTASAEIDYRDFTVHRALAQIHVRKEQWREARYRYENASKYAAPYLSEIAAECALGASMACRQRSEFDAAYELSSSAIDLNPRSLIAQYDHAVNSVCLSQSSRNSTKLQVEAIERLKHILGKDDLFAARVDTDPYFDPIRAGCNQILNDLRREMSDRVVADINAIETLWKPMQQHCKEGRLILSAEKAIEGRAALYTLCSRGSICDLREALKRTTRVRSDVVAVRNFVNDVSDQTRSVRQTYLFALRITGEPSTKAPFERGMSVIDRMWSSGSFRDLAELAAYVPPVRDALFIYAEQRLSLVRNAVDNKLKRMMQSAATERQLLESKIKDLQATIHDPGGEWLAPLLFVFYVFAVIVLWRSVHPGFWAGVLIIGGGVVAAIAAEYITCLAIGFQCAFRITPLRERLESCERTDAIALQSTLKSVDDAIQKCRRKEMFDVPASVSDAVRTYLSSESPVNAMHA